MALVGLLEEFRAPDLLQHASACSRSGVLTLRHNDESVVIAFRQGRVGSVRWSHQERLGVALTKVRKLSPAQIVEAMRLVTDVEQDRDLARVLVEARMISREELRAIIKQRMQEAISHALRWDKGTFSFEPCSPDDVEPQLGELVETEGLVMEAARRADALQPILEALPPLDTVVEFSPLHRLRLGKISLSPQEWQVVSLVDGERDMNAIVHASHIPELEALRVMLGLLSAGVLTYAAKRRRAQVMRKYVKEGLRELLAKARATACFLADDAGKVFGRAAIRTDIDLASLSLLSVASLHALGQIARLLGEPEFGVAIHQGQDSHIYVSPLQGGSIVAVLFEQSRNLGAVRVATRDFVYTYGPLLDEVPTTDTVIA